METALRILVPRIIPGVSYEVFAFDGKQDLLDKLPKRLDGYQRWAGNVGLGLVVVVDRDADDCNELKDRLAECAHAAGMTSVSRAAGRPGTVLNRIAIEELEAWFFGDVPALVQAYPGVPVSLGAGRKYRDPDAVTGGTWENLERVLMKAGHHPGGLAKSRAAADIATYMDVETNESRSFQVFRDGVRLLVQEGTHAQA